MYTDVHPANPAALSRSRKAGCLETAPPGCVSLVTFLCTSTAPQERREQRSWPRSGGGQDARSQESNPLAGGEWKQCTSRAEEQREGQDGLHATLSRAPRAIRYANVRSGILPPQSCFRWNNEREETPSPPNVARLGRPGLAKQPGAAHPAPRVQRRANQWFASAPLHPLKGRAKGGLGLRRNDQVIENAIRLRERTAQRRCAELRPPQVKTPAFPGSRGSARCWPGSPAGLPRRHPSPRLLPICLFPGPCSARRNGRCARASAAAHRPDR